jgi:hypothetical protein
MKRAYIKMVRNVIGRENHEKLFKIPWSLLGTAHLNCVKEKDKEYDKKVINEMSIK